jgi:hypothetical protein
MAFEWFSLKVDRLNPCSLVSLSWLIVSLVCVLFPTRLFNWSNENFAYLSFLQICFERGLLPDEGVGWNVSDILELLGDLMAVLVKLVFFTLSLLQCDTAGKFERFGFDVFRLH